MSQTPTNGDEARKALEQSGKRMAEQSARWPAIRARVNSLLSQVEDNHLSARIIEAIRSESP